MGAGCRGFESLYPDQYVVRGLIDRRICRTLISMGHHTKDKGDLGVGFVIADLIRNDIKVALPISEHLPFECIAISPEGGLCRVSVKSRRLRDKLASVPGFRVEADTDSEKIGQKIRKHLWTEKVPFVCVVGDQEVESGDLAVRHRKDGDLGSLSPQELAELLIRMTQERR